MDYTTLLVYNTKSTCWADKTSQPTDQKSEIFGIEVAIVNTVENKIIEHESILIKPKTSKISAYCENIYKIPQNEINKNGIPFEQAYRRLRVHYTSRDRISAAWNARERQDLTKQCEAAGLESLFVNPFHSIQGLYSLMLGADTETNEHMLGNALKRLDIKPSVNVAYDIACIFVKMAKGLRPAVKTRIFVNSSDNKCA